jgi:PAS domain S-box-containing protein
LILDANAQAEKLFACRRSEIIGRHQRTLHPKGAETVVAEQFRQVISGELGAVVVAEIVRADGSVSPVEITSEVADLSDGRRLVLGVFRPI